MVLQERHITGAYYGSVHPPIDLPIMANMAMADSFKMDELISRTYKFDEINEGFGQVIQDNVARGVIMMN